MVPSVMALWCRGAFSTRGRASNVSISDGHGSRVHGGSGSVWAWGAEGAKESWIVSRLERRPGGDRTVFIAAAVHRQAPALARAVHDKVAIKVPTYIPTGRATYIHSSLRPSPTVTQLLSQLLSCTQKEPPSSLPRYATQIAIIGRRRRRRERGLIDSSSRPARQGEQREWRRGGGGGGKQQT